ncbi:unnamed protein product [Didymodactylos carnosus]|uniref:C2 domain-containing protein n=1 Tax=Didymodactylos carnosus TaxID=1234261 RepID=A0A815I1A1_9BILA|nr:unnamed protein product [Didymodactylos carnosus]CAF1361348.1 unnamed protein product [Didymodactylos carnosus]CAF4020781.1 unnamed protein product [Didymodactylos carnosus]CAF4240068.1 unnamed protein product [Didymodactylos carnosus]
MTTLIVTIIAGKNLKDEDMGAGKNDAYVEVYVDDDYKQRTKTINDSNNPKWNDQMDFNLNGNERHLHLHVYDQDTGSDDSIGSAQIDLQEIRQGGYNKWVPIHDHGFGRLGKDGQVHVKAHIN